MTYTRSQWSIGLLFSIGNAMPSTAIVQWLVNWTCLETSRPPGAAYNLLNTTEANTPGVVSDFNSVGVKNYDTFAHGIQANAKVLRNGRYPVLEHYLATESGFDLPAINAELAVWGTGQVAGEIAAMHGNGNEIFGSGGPMNTIPAGWQDDGTTLTAPNGHKVVQGFREWILTHNWDGANNQPLEDELHADPVQFHAPEFGAGQRQCFPAGILWWTSEKGVIWESQLGWEAHAAYAAIAAIQQPPPAPIPPDVAVQLQAAKDAIQKALGEL